MLYFLMINSGSCATCNIDKSFLVTLWLRKLSNNLDPLQIMMQKAKSPRAEFLPAYNKFFSLLRVSCEHRYY